MWPEAGPEHRGSFLSWKCQWFILEGTDIYIPGMELLSSPRGLGQRHSPRAYGISDPLSQTLTEVYQVRGPLNSESVVGIGPEPWY